MSRPRNNFAIPKGDYALYGVLTIAEVDTVRTELGELDDRFTRFLRRYILPVSTGTGDSRKAFLKIPRTTLQRKPGFLQDAVAPHLTDDRDALETDEPWLTDESNWSESNHSVLDSAIGEELEHIRPWEANGETLKAGDVRLYKSDQWLVRQDHDALAGREPDVYRAGWHRLQPLLENGGVPPWATQVEYAVGDRVTYEGTTYTCLQAHTSQTGWEPPKVPALWEAES